MKMIALKVPFLDGLDLQESRRFTPAFCSI